VKKATVEKRLQHAESRIAQLSELEERLANVTCTDLNSHSHSQWLELCAETVTKSEALI